MSGRPHKNRLADAMTLLAMARTLPTVDTLMRSYGLPEAEARKLLAAEESRRSTLL